MSSQPQVASFVVRCAGFLDAGQPSPTWRITVSHVQGEEEITVTSFEEVSEYMKEKLSG
ncbi:hypothetical protein ACQCU1_08455 [Sutcliffiella horikoshii]|uniref:hypothetical protein n=1 Tax=Sutcliffiella horikoshii TaxID=79883 RepID=UPI0012F85607|nr:hypothetical protein [Sutcliffiella horikoshii]